MEEVIRGKLPAYGDAQRETSSAEARRRQAPPESVLKRIETPADLEELSRKELHQLCDEVREYIIEVVSTKGGHLGASLGVVELCVALESVLDLPRDRLVWDTGHQGYVHKVLTGRREQLWNIREMHGISGFLKREESPYDTFGAGHASTAISAALGMATARDLAGDDYRVAAVIGDGAMTGGLAYEALNNGGQSRRKLLVVLNDNGMSIAPNVGALSQHLTTIRTNPHIKRLHDESLQLIERLPALGEPIGELAKRFEAAVKSAVTPGGLFEALGFDYFGPVDGHNLDHLLDLLPKVIDRKGPVLLHVLTKKGHGLPWADQDYESFHAVKPSFDKTTGKVAKKKKTSSRPSPPAYTSVFGAGMVRAAEAFPRMVAITAAMPTGTGLMGFKEKYPSRFFDVGIAEAHAICFAAGLACDGARPVATIYSTFLQRAFDQIVHDVALQKLPVVFALDRGGLVGADGPTHHGVLDLSYLRCVPGMTVAAPKDGNEMLDLLWTGLAQDRGPFAFRYPRDSVPASYDPEREPRRLEIGSWEVLEEGGEVAFLAVGTMVRTALEAREQLASEGVGATVVNCRFVKPLDTELLVELRRRYPLLITVEENVLAGGFGDGVRDALDRLQAPLDGVVRMGIADEFVTHGTRDQLLEIVGLTPGHLARTALDGLAGLERKSAS